MEENEKVYQKTEDVQIKKMGMSVLCGARATIEELNILMALK